MTYFPSPFLPDETAKSENVDLGFVVNSGKNALRLVLRSFSLKEGANVGIPAFCCDAVFQAVKEEKLTPCFFDLKEEEGYWADYSKETIKEKNIEAIILTHLYGFIHPDTKSIMEFCEKEGVALIHDAAQSFGINSSVLGNKAIVYSFGPGKSTTAAMGGEIVNFKGNGISIKKIGLADSQNAKLFFKSRLNEYKFSFLDKLLLKIFSKLKSNESDFIELSEFQKQKAKEAKWIVLNKGSERVLRYEHLMRSIKEQSSVKIAYDSEEGLKFKIVLYISGDPDKFVKYLFSNNIHFFRLYDSIDVEERLKAELPFFKKSGKRIIEISTERSIPMPEMDRIAKVLEAYK